MIMMTGREGLYKSHYAENKGISSNKLENIDLWLYANHQFTICTIATTNM